MSRAKRIVEESETFEEAMARLSQAFAPSTPQGLAERLWEIRFREIPALKSEAANLEAIVKEHCERTGEVLDVGGGSYRIRREVKVTGDTEKATPLWKFENVLVWERDKRKTDADSVAESS